MSYVSQDRVNQWLRSRFNPIRGLRPDRLVTILEQFHAGYPKEAAQLWEAMERRDGMLRTVTAKRKKAVARAQYEILTLDKSERALFHKQALEKFYDNLVVTDVTDRDKRGGIGLLRRQMADAIGKGYAVHEIVWKPFKGDGTRRVLGKKVRQRDLKKATASKGAGLAVDVEDHAGAGDWLTAELRFVPLWFFERTTGKLRYLPTEGTTEGIELKEGEWMVTTGDCLMEACSVAYIYKHFSMRDWLAYSEKFGLPGVQVKTPAAPGSAEWQQAEEIAARFMNDFACVTGLDELINIIKAEGGAGSIPMPELAERMDRTMAALWRGADLSTISKGGESSGASLQGEESDLLQEDDANDQTEKLWSLDKMVIQQVCGDDEPLAYIKILPPKKQAVDQDIHIDSFLVSHGVPLGQDDVYERYGRPMPQEGDPLLTSPGPAVEAEEGKEKKADGAFGNDAQSAKAKPGLAADTAARIRDAKRKADEPLIAMAKKLDGLQGQARENALRSMLANWPELKRQHAAAMERAVAPVLEEAQAAAMIDGFERNRRARGAGPRKTETALERLGAAAKRLFGGTK